MISISGSLVAVFSGLLFKHRLMWNILAVAASVLFGTVTFAIGALKEKIKDDILRLTIITLIYFFPFLNFGFAKKKSIENKYMTHYSEVKDVVCSDSVLKKRLIKSAYLGATSSHYIFFVPDTVIVVNSNRVEALMLEDVFNEENNKRWRER